MALQALGSHQHQWQHPQHHRQAQCTDTTVSSTLCCVNECWLLTWLSVLWLCRALYNTSISGSIPGTIGNLNALTYL